MKKALIMLCILASVVLFAACSDDNTFRSGSVVADGRMSVVYNSGYVIIYRDNKTGVQYIFRANCGACVMVDRDGKPYIGGGYNE